MEKLKDELRQLKPKLILVTYAVLLFLIAINFNSIISYITSFLSYFSPLFVAIGLAFTLNISMSAIERLIMKYTSEKNIIRRFSRIISIIGAIIIVAALIIFLGIIVLPEFFASIGNFILNITDYFNNLSENLSSILQYFNIDIQEITNSDLEALLASAGLDYSNIIKEASNWILGTGQGAIDYVVSMGSNLFMFFMAFTISIYLLASKEVFIHQLKKVILALLPYDLAEDVLESSEVANEIFSNFIGGKCVECVVVGLLTYAGMAIFNMPFAILISCLCGALTIIPVFGSLVATIIGCLLLLSVNIWLPIMFFFLYWFVQILDGNFIYPKFIGKNMGLPAVWILTSVLVFSSIYGFLGALLAAPTTACIYTFFANYVRKRLKKKKLDVELDGSIKKEA